jgi:hypothetical protein
MRASLRPVAVGAATAALAVGLAAGFATIQRGGTHELPGFALWCIPLGTVIGVLAQRPRFIRLPPLARAAAAGATGLLAGLGLTLVGWLLIGGWMLAWDFPVLYCWSVAGVIGALAGAVANGSVRPGYALGGLVVALAPVAALAWVGTRPTPAVLVVYHDDPARDAAQYVLDSVLTRPHPSGQGRDLRWESTVYARTRTADGHTAALIGLRRAADRDSLRAALAGHPLVMSVTDTLLPR